MMKLSITTDLRLVDVPDPEGLDDETTPVIRRIDILENERAHGRISEAAFLTGRHVQEIMERAVRSTGSSWSDGGRVDAASAHETAIVVRLEDARAVRGLEDKMARHLGMMDTKILKMVLGGASYAEVARWFGKTGVRGSTYVAMRFRDALEGLSKAFAEKGVKKFVA